jgi:aryl-alcohol dehydrogenase-like predicted oxidoreductase
LATKFGWISHVPGGGGGLDSRPANVRAAVEGSLKRLATDHIDLYDQHSSRTPCAPWQTSWPRARSAVSDSPRRGSDTIRRAHAVHPVTALQSEYALWTRDQEAEVLPLLPKLRTGFVAYSPLGHGFLTGKIRSMDDLADDDWRKTNPRFIGENFQRNLPIAGEVDAVAREVGATPAQVALAWLLAKGDDIVPIPGTKRVSRGRGEHRRRRASS